jgi:hypothetical protein
MYIVIIIVMQAVVLMGSYVPMRALNVKFGDIS